MKYKLNGEWVDLSIKALDSMVIGSIIQFIGTNLPTGWLECDGSSITQNDYPELYNLIGGTLPDFRGRVLVGQDTNDTDFDTLGETGGSKELQQHTHQIQANDGAGSTYGVNVQANSGQKYSGYIGEAGTGNSGNLQPYAVVKHIIKAKNTTPTMASVVNTHSNSTTDTYSCDYIDSLFNTRGNYKKLADISNQEITITLTNDNLTNYKYILSVSGYGYQRSCTILPMALFRSYSSNFKQLNQYVQTYNSTAFTSISYISDTQFKIYGAVGTDTTTQVYGIK